MKEVAELVYEEFIPHQSSIKEDIESNPEFRIIKVENIKRIIFLAEEDLSNFISMTPYLYKFKEGQLELLKELPVTISFEIIIVKYDWYELIDRTSVRYIKLNLYVPNNWLEIFNFDRMPAAIDIEKGNASKTDTMRLHPC